MPAFVRLRALLEDEVLPRARPDDRAGLGALPGGAELYARAIRGFSTLDLTAERVHEIGLAEVARTDAELTEFGRRVLRSDGLADTLGRLLAGDGIRFADREELLAVARDVVERAEAAAPEWFGLRHDKPCLVRAAPPQEEQTAPFAYYFPPAPDGSRPGVFYVNTSAPETRARFDVAVDACHEAVPGHHLQIAVARRLTGLPAFRRLGQPPAYQEGWGLYAEQAGEEMGLYRTDLDRLGRRAKDALRSCRLVVDTGLHALGWSRQEAIDYLTAHTAFPAELAAREVDRYLAWPGQALSYKLGQLEILALREEARERQGPAFDIRRFHDVVLGFRRTATGHAEGARPDRTALTEEHVMNRLVIAICPLGQFRANPEIGRPNSATLVKTCRETVFGDTVATPEVEEALPWTPLRSPSERWRCLPKTVRALRT